MSFEQKLKFGKAGESLIANWLKQYGYSILPVYEKEMDLKKGPQLFTPDENLVAPDLLVIRRDGRHVWWIEAKHKTAFSYHRITNRWVTGIDLRHYKDYLKIQDLCPWSVWLLFLQRSGRAKDTPKDKTSPVGLYGGILEYLYKNESHRSDKWGKSGMVYWSENILIKLAELDEVV